MHGRLAIASSVLACVACAQVLGITDVPPAPGGDAGGSDAIVENDSNLTDSALDAGSGRCDPSKPFQTPVLVPELIATAGVANSHFRLTGDELAGVYQSDNAIVEVRRADGGSTWNTKFVVGPSGTSSPALTADGLGIYYISGGAILQATRKTLSDAFDTGMPLDSNVNDVSFTNSAPFVTAAGTELFFARRPSDAGALDIVDAVANGTSWDPPGALSFDDSLTNQTEPVLSPNGTVIYLSSDASRPTRDIFRATRQNTSSSFSQPVLVDNVNSDVAIDEPSWVSDDDCFLYLTSNRPSGDSQAADAQIYLARRPL